MFLFYFVLSFLNFLEFVINNFVNKYIYISQSISISNLHYLYCLIKFTNTKRYIEGINRLSVHRDYVCYCYCTNNNSRNNDICLSER